MSGRFIALAPPAIMGMSVIGVTGMNFCISARDSLKRWTSFGPLWYISATAFRKSISSVAFGLIVFDLRSGLNVERIFSGPTYPRSQMFETYIRVSCHHVLASKIRRKLIPTSMRSN